MGVEIITKPKIQISEDILAEIKTQTAEMGQVVIHFLFESNQIDYYIRIWPTTFLYDNHSAHRSELIHHENISLYHVGGIL